MGYDIYIRAENKESKEIEEILHFEQSEIHEFFKDEFMFLDDNKEYNITNSVREFCLCLISLREYLDEERYDRARGKDIREFEKYDTLIDKIQYDLDRQVVTGDFNKYHKFTYLCHK